VTPSDTVTAHVHAWTPLAGWTGRYRCDGCGAIGYRATMANLAAGRRDAIYPYLCAKRIAGSKCGRIAVQVRRDRAQDRCAEHRS
jgi:hypothetical protein